MGMSPCLVVVGSFSIVGLFSINGGCEWLLGSLLWAVVVLSACHCGCSSLFNCVLLMVVGSHCEHLWMVVVHCCRQLSLFVVLIRIVGSCVVVVGVCCCWCLWAAIGGCCWWSLLFVIVVAGGGGRGCGWHLSCALVVVVWRKEAMSHAVTVASRLYSHVRIIMCM